MRIFPKSSRFPHFTRETIEAEAKARKFVYTWMGDSLVNCLKSSMHDFGNLICCQITETISKNSNIEIRNNIKTLMFKIQNKNVLILVFSVLAIDILGKFRRILRPVGGVIHSLEFVSSFDIRISDFPVPHRWVKRMHL